MLTSRLDGTGLNRSVAAIRICSVVFGEFLGAVMVVSVTFVLINLLVDLLHLILDPRLRREAA